MKDLLKYKGYRGTVDFSDADNVFWGKVLGIKGLILYEGDDEQKLEEDFKGAINDYLEICKEKGVIPEKPRIRRRSPIFMNVYADTDETKNQNIIK